jgi:hypothetical protein
MIYHMKKWPETIDELIHVTTNIVNDFNNEIQNKSLLEISENIVIRPIPYIIRLHHVTKYRKNAIISENIKHMLDQYIKNIYEKRLQATIKKFFKNSIDHYEKWISQLSTLIAIDDMEPYNEILDLRDDIQGELEILTFLNEDITDDQQKLKSIDERFNKIGPLISNKVFTNINHKNYPKEVYWWRYFGGKTE